MAKNSKRDPSAHAATAAVPNPASSLVASMEDKGGKSWLIIAGPMILPMERTLLTTFKILPLRCGPMALFDSWSHDQNTKTERNNCRKRCAINAEIEGKYEDRIEN